MRARRHARTIGIVFLAPLPLGIAAFAFSVAEGGVAWTRLATLAIALIMLTAAGVWLLRYARAGAPAEKPSTTDRNGPAKSEPAPDPEGWRTLGNPMKGTILTATMGPSIILLAVVPVQFLLFLDDVPWGLAIWLVTIGVAAAVAVSLIRRSQAPVIVHPVTEQIRLGKKTLSWKDITRAELFADPPWSGAHRTLILTLGDAEGARGRVVLRRKENLTLGAGDTELALLVIERSAIDLPRDKDDPRGRFSRQLYPNSLTKAEASGVVAHPPSMNDELPIRLAS